MKQITARLFILAGAIFWGTTGTVQIFAPLTASPLTIGAMRVIMGGVILTLLLFSSGNYDFKKKWSKKDLIMAAVFMSSFQPFFFMGVKKTGVAVGTVVAIASAPIFAGIFSYLLMQKKPERSWYPATFLAVSGCILLFTNNDLSVDLLGIIFSLGAGVSYAFFSLYNKKLLKNHAPLEVVTLVFVIGSLFFLPVFFLADLNWVFNLRGITTVLYLGGVTAALAFLFYAIGLRYTTTATAVTLTLAEPLTASLLGIFLIGEKLSLLSLLGLLLLISGIIILFINKGESANGRISNGK